MLSQDVAHQPSYLEMMCTVLGAIQTQVVYRTTIVIVHTSVQPRPEIAPYQTERY